MTLTGKGGRSMSPNVPPSRRNTLKERSSSFKVQRQNSTTARNSSIPNVEPQMANISDRRESVQTDQNIGEDYNGVDADANGDSFNTLYEEIKVQTKQMKSFLY